MKTALSVLLASLSLGLSGRDTNRYESVFTDANGVTWSQRGGLSPSNYVVTAVSVSNLFLAASRDDGSPECVAAKALVRAYVDKVAQDYSAAKLTDQDVFFDNLRTNLNASYSAAMSLMVSTVVTNRVNDGYLATPSVTNGLASAESLAFKRDLADNVCVAGSFTPWDFGGTGLGVTGASLDLERKTDGTWSYFLDMSYAGGSYFGYVSESGTRDEMENRLSVSFTAGDPSVTYAITRSAVAVSNDAFVTYSGVTNAIGSVAAFRDSAAADGVITNCVDDMTQAQKTELLKRLVEYVKRLERRN